MAVIKITKTPHSFDIYSDIKDETKNEHRSYILDAIWHIVANKYTTAKLPADEVISIRKKYNKLNVTISHYLSQHDAIQYLLIIVECYSLGIYLDIDE